jgi:hypothetical protein
MKTVEFKFSIDQKVCVEDIGFSGIVAMCSIQGNPEEKTYYIQGAAGAGWYPERLIKEWNK